MMFSETHELMIGGIFALRSWCKEHLPIENSLIAYDLILILAINNYAKNDISIKELFASVPHSYTAVRGHYLRQWILNLFPASSSLTRQTSYAKATRGWVFFCNQELIQNNAQSYKLNVLTKKYIFIAPLQSM